MSTLRRNSSARMPYELPLSVISVATDGILADRQEHYNLTVSTAVYAAEAHAVRVYRFVSSRYVLSAVVSSADVRVRQ